MEEQRNRKYWLIVVNCLAILLGFISMFFITKQDYSDSTIITVICLLGLLCGLIGILLLPFSIYSTIKKHITEKTKKWWIITAICFGLFFGAVLIRVIDSTIYSTIYIEPDVVFDPDDGAFHCINHCNYENAAIYQVTISMIKIIQSYYLLLGIISVTIATYHSIKQNKVQKKKNSKEV